MMRLVSRLDCAQECGCSSTGCSRTVCGTKQMGNLPLINSNDYLWAVVCRIIVFLAALVSNQWEITIFTARFPIKCSGVEIFPSILTGNLECFYISQQNESVFIFPTPRIRRVLQVFFQYKALGKWLGALVWAVGGSM